ncbi:hypothetical protein TWF569_009015 [Orbilia oligospora]|uniref:Uncharacterized protein n=1 Tax=Orbilia oligospora TaxID=2813651 RepID=A0A7C8JLV7_ORBOL|nr:hypothetical protein TWF102_008398 [Orbilia oligospora]KAF3096310.1 hypothetical protein TWF103_009883 [Orbilia oligospora]KAF3097994.1 hypothetical protein TWF706_006934 [Orbilia oligospora]KAF3124832.1 hypothetical protein TWF703_011191 [Orbilia oligospora]KAF3145452.1 hypothetical protein TWF594_004389 [Orbilia oligospora]
MKLPSVIQYAVVSGVTLFRFSAARVLDNPARLSSRQSTESPFYPRNLEDLTLVRAAYDELGHQIQTKLYKASPECLHMVTDKLEATGSICPARDNILVGLIRETFKQLSIRLPRLRSRIGVAPSNGVAPVSWQEFNDNYSKLDGAITFALREIQKQVCLILADTDTKTSDAVYGGTMTPATINGTSITVTSLQDSFVQIDSILENGIDPKSFDQPAQATTEDIFSKLRDTRALFVTLGKINDVQSLTTGAQQCISLLAELAAAALIGGLGGILTGSSGGGLPSLPRLPGLGS